MITVTFNSAATLREFWVNSTWTESIEWIVVDNASSDDSVAVAESLGARVIPLSENMGFSYANNVGAATSSSDVLLFANPDLRFNNSEIQPLAHRALACQGIVAPQLLNPDGSPQENGRGIPYIHRKLRHMFGSQHPQTDPYLIIAKPDEVVETLWVMGAALAIPRIVFESLGGWDDQFFIYYEDHDLGIRARRAGFPVTIDGSIRWVHGWARETSRTRSLSPWKHELASAFRFYIRFPWAFAPVLPPPRYTNLNRNLLS